MLMFKRQFIEDNGFIFGKWAVMALISYEPLWNTMHTLEKLCKVLECSPNDVIAFTDD